MIEKGSAYLMAVRGLAWSNEATSQWSHSRQILESACALELMLELERPARVINLSAGRYMLCECIQCPINVLHYIQERLVCEVKLSSILADTAYTLNTPIIKVGQSVHTEYAWHPCLPYRCLVLCTGAACLCTQLFSQGGRCMHTQLA